MPLNPARVRSSVSWGVSASRKPECASSAPYQRVASMAAFTTVGCVAKIIVRGENDNGRSNVTVGPVAEGDRVKPAQEM